MTLFVQHFLRFTPFVRSAECRAPSGFINGQPQTASSAEAEAEAEAERQRRSVHQPHQRKVNICIMCSCMRVPACQPACVCVCV